MTYPTTWTGRAFIATSLDGFIARGDGDIGWLTDPPGRRHADIESTRPAESWETFFSDVDHVVMGRGTYEKVITFDEWPYAGKAVVVLSTTLPADDGRVTVVRTLDDACRILADAGARQVYVDGGRVIQTFLERNLIRELTVSRAPVLIGAGLPLFGALGRDVQLTLVGSHATADGMTHATYRVDVAVSTSA